MAAPKVYRFDDDGAPSLTSADKTKFIQLLKACLVDGYGSKPAAGWTMPFISGDGSTAAFRNNPTTGTGFYLQVSHGSNAHTPFLRGYESMTSETDGVNPFSPDSITIATQISQSNNQNIARPWVLIADDRFFWFICYYGATYSDFTNDYYVTFCFGDGIPISEADKYFCVLFGRSANSNTYVNYAIAWNLPNSTSASSYRSVARNMAGDVQDDAKCNLIFGGGPMLHESTAGAWGNGNLPRTLGNEIMSRPYVNDGTAYSFRGYLPGLWYPCHRIGDFNNFEQLEIGTHRFVIFKHQAVLEGNMHAIDISEHWRP